MKSELTIALRGEASTASNSWRCRNVTLRRRNAERAPPKRPRQTASRARPLARRARSTALPPRLFMRTRNPCVRLRRVFDG
jgi:hypothetical protein